METGTIQKLEDLLLVAIPRDLSDTEVIRLRRAVAEAVRKYNSQWVLLDFSQVDICDSFFGRFIESMAHMASLMGTEVIISGLQDAVIETLIELGMTLPNIRSVLDVDEALALSRSMRLQSRLDIVQDDLGSIYDADFLPNLNNDIDWFGNSYE